MEKDFLKYGIKMPQVLLPEKGTNLTKWAVVACDQYTSNPEYWEKVRDFVGNSPSTLNMILPEVYLNSPDVDERIAAINQRMYDCINAGILQEIEPGFIITERTTRSGKSHRGILVALDLECYDYSNGSTSLIRATEGTVLERIPSRIKIREKAPLELPHVMVLIDDPDKSVIEPLFENMETSRKLYDFDLMFDSGHLTGYLVNDRDRLMSLLNGLEKLSDADRFKEKYGTSTGGIMMYAVGDGNHSLAAAKAHWENVKKQLASKDLETHPARYALVELVNIHDGGIVFEPIHRVVFNTQFDEFAQSFRQYFRHENTYIYEFAGESEAEAAAGQMKNTEGFVFPYVTQNNAGLLITGNTGFSLPTAAIQAFLDDYVMSHKGVYLDYVHGKETVKELCMKKDTIGIYLPPTDKNRFFRTIVLDGVLPRKTFSMGEADEKRFYLECRKII